MSIKSLRSKYKALPPLIPPLVWDNYQPETKTNFETWYAHPRNGFTIVVQRKKQQLVNGKKVKRYIVFFKTPANDIIPMPDIFLDPNSAKKAAEQKWNKLMKEAFQKEGD